MLKEIKGNNTTKHLIEHAIMPQVVCTNIYRITNKKP